MATAVYDTFAGKVFRIVIVGRDKKHKGHGDPTREVFETVVFVVVLVLMLKLFVAEAFVIPTGSMASTLWGDQVRVQCPVCDCKFPVTAAARGGARVVPRGTCCQNCGVEFDIPNPTDWNSGDRVLVAKYEYHIHDPRRFDVPVFKYPEEPYSRAEKSAMNYIKRLIGLPGETIAIYKGDLYRTDALKYEGKIQPNRSLDLWKHDYTYPNDPGAAAYFNGGLFEPIRKDPDQILAVRRLVFDLDLPPRGLTGIAQTRWNPVPGAGTGWVLTAKGFDHTGTATGWMRYYHVAPGSWKYITANGTTTIPKQPDLIRDHLAYNVTDGSNPAQYWVPDLIVECSAKFDSASDKLTLELTKASDKFQAVFDNGVCRLLNVRAGVSEPTVMAETKTRITAGGTYSLRFANVDSRLTVWVDGRPLEFGAGADYPPPNRMSFEHTTDDLHEPARIGATGNVSVTHVQLWRDVYYTCREPGDCRLETYYVQPGHYFCLGDNSASSADGRSWGLVPERLVLGRAVVVRSEEHTSEL